MVSLFGGSLVFLTWNQVDLTKYCKTAPQVPSSLNRNWVHCAMISVLGFYSLFSEKLASIFKMSAERAALLLKYWPSWCIILGFFFLGLIGTYCHLKPNQISQFNVIKIFLTFEVYGSSLADKRDNGQNFTKVIILCQTMSTISRTALLGSIGWGSRETVAEFWVKIRFHSVTTDHEF